MAIRKNSSSSGPPQYQVVSDSDDSSAEVVPHQHQKPSSEGVAWLKNPEKINKFGNPLKRLPDGNELKERFLHAKATTLEKHGALTKAEDAWKLLESCRHTFAGWRTNKPDLHTLAEQSAHLKILDRSPWVNRTIVREGKNLVHQILSPKSEALLADEFQDKLHAIDARLESALMWLESRLGRKSHHEGRGILSSSEAFDAKRKTLKE